MPRSNRLRNYAIALVLALVVATALGWRIGKPAWDLDAHIQHQAAEKAAKYANTTDIAVQSEGVGISAPPTDGGIAEPRDSDREGQRNEYDLEAQQVMANWTRVMGQAAIIGMGIGTVGLFLIFTTFLETSKAADSANKTYQAFVKVERPTLIPTIAGVQTSFASDKKTKRKAITLDITNLGKGDALLKSFVWGFSNEEEGPDVLSGPPRTKTIKGGESYGVGPFRGTTEPSQAETLIAVLRYESVFSSDHLTRRRWRIREGVAQEVPFTDGPADR